MNKREAKSLMEDGVRVTHRTFLDDEWMTMKKGEVLTDDGFLHSPLIFWSYRNSEVWDNDYFIYD